MRARDVAKFFHFIHHFPPARRYHMYALVAGGIMMSVLELVGIGAIFPFVVAAQNPDSLLLSRKLAPLLDLLDITTGKGALNLLGLLVIGVFVVKNICQILYLRFEFDALAQWRIRIAGLFFSGYLNSPYELTLSRTSFGQMSLITTAVPYVLNNFVHQFLNLFAQVMIGGLLLGYIFYLEPALAITMIIMSVLLMSGHSLALRRMAVRLGEKSRLLSARQIAILQQSFKGYKDTRIHQKGSYFEASFRRVNRELSHVEEKVVFLQTLPMASVELMMMTLAITAFAMLLSLSSSPDIVLAKLAALTMVTLRIIPVINRSITAIMMIDSSTEPLETLLSEGKILGLFNQKQEHFPDASEVPQLPFNHHLALRNVSYHYPETERNAIDGVSLSIRRGEFLGITGPSGSGKSTLVSILLCFIEPKKGDVAIDGKMLAPEDYPGLHKIVGYVDQSIFMLDASIAENVAFGEEIKDIDRPRVVAALKKAQLWDYVTTLEQGIDTMVGEDGKSLSGGQRQRLSIARAFYKDLQILILDEASATLDVETEHHFFEYLYSLKGEITVVMVAHRLSTLQQCDRIVFLDQGNVLDEGSFSELAKNNPTFRRYVEYATLKEQTGTDNEAQQ